MLADKHKILIVDDDDDVRTQMKWALNQEYNILLAEDRVSALRLLSQERPSAVTLDLGLPPSPGDAREGFVALSEMLQFDPLLKVIVITGQDEKQNGMEAIGQGALDFFCKPVNIDELKVVIARAIHVQRLERARHELREPEPLDSFEGIIGCSPQIQKVFTTVKKIASTEASVLIVGESG